jgi:chromosome partitioning protein
VQELFRAPATRSWRGCTEPVYDDNSRATEGWMLACDGGLHVEETQALMRWLIGESKADLRYVLREALHSDAVQTEYDFILLDCPPRLTPTCVNALTACDYLLVPVILDEKSTEGPPQLLKWIWDRRESLDLKVGGVGLVANKTKGGSRESLVGREKEEWAALVQQCRDAWGGSLYGFDTVVPLFNEPAMERSSPPATPT